MNLVCKDLFKFCIFFSYLCIFFIYLTQHPSCNFCSHNKACIEHVDYCKHEIFICGIEMFPSKQHQKSECNYFCETQWYDHSIAISNEYGKSAQIFIYGSNQNSPCKDRSCQKVIDEKCLTYLCH